MSSENPIFQRLQSETTWFNWNELRTLMTPVWTQVTGEKAIPTTVNIIRQRPLSPAALTDPAIMMDELSLAAQAFTERDEVEIYVSEETDAQSHIASIFHELTHNFYHRKGARIIETLHGRAIGDLRSHYSAEADLAANKRFNGLLGALYPDLDRSVINIFLTANAVDESAIQSQTLVLLRNFSQMYGLPSFLPGEIERLFESDNPMRYIPLIVSLVRNHFDIDKTADYFFKKRHKPQDIINDVAPHIGSLANERRLNQESNAMYQAFGGTGRFRLSNFGSQVVQSWKRAKESFGSYKNDRRATDTMMPQLINSSLLANYMKYDGFNFARDLEAVLRKKDVPRTLIHYISLTYNKLLTDQTIEKQELVFAIDMFNYLENIAPIDAARIDGIVGILRREASRR